MAARAAAQRHPAQSQEAGGLPSAGDRRPFHVGYRVAAARADGSTSALLVVEADGKQVFQKRFQCGPGKGEWKKAEFKSAVARLPESLRPRLYGHDSRGHRQIRVRVADGDWLEIGQIGLKPATAGTKEVTLALKQEWGKKPTALPLRAGCRRAVRWLGLADARQGVAMEDVHRALERGGVQGDRRHGGGMGRVQQNAARRRTALGRGLPEQLAEGRTGAGRCGTSAARSAFWTATAATSGTRISRATSSTASSWTCSSATELEASVSGRSFMQQRR